MHGLLIALFVFSVSQTEASVPESIALSMVPRGKVDIQQGRDFIIKSNAGTKIRIEFKRDGKLEEAAGDNLNKGDDLEPGEGLISLSSAAQHIQASGKKPEGHWSLEFDQKLGWIYEVNHQHIIDAKSGKFLNENDSQSLPQIGSSQ